MHEHADVERQQDPDFAQEREAEDLRAEGDLEVREDGDDRERDRAHACHGRSIPTTLFITWLAKKASAPRIPIVAAL